MAISDPITRAMSQRMRTVWWSEDLITKTISGGAIFTDEALALDMLPFAQGSLAGLLAQNDLREKQQKGEGS
jgi:hypothetical protein